MKRRGRYWKPKWIAHVRAWGASTVHHTEPFAKRNTKRRAERRFVLVTKRAELCS